MNDDRARPQYGEYATPEEQRDHIRDPQARHEVTEAHGAAEQARRAGVDPHAMAGWHDGGGVDGRPQARAQHPSMAGKPAQRERHRWDLVLTLLLLAVGLVNVLTSIPGYLHFSDTLAAVYSQFGVGSAPGGSAVAGAGIALITIQGVVWLIAGLLSWISLRAARITFWIPIVGAIVAYAGVVVVVLVVVLGDPNFVSFVQSGSL